MFEPLCFECEPEDEQDLAVQLCGSQEVLDARAIARAPHGARGHAQIIAHRDEMRRLAQLGGGG